MLHWFDQHISLANTVDAHLLGASLKINHKQNVKIQTPNHSRVSGAKVFVGLKDLLGCSRAQLIAVLRARDSSGDLLESCRPDIPQSSGVMTKWLILLIMSTLLSPYTNHSFKLTNMTTPEPWPVGSDFGNSAQWQVSLRSGVSSLLLDLPYNSLARASPSS